MNNKSEINTILQMYEAFLQSVFTNWSIHTSQAYDGKIMFACDELGDLEDDLYALQLEVANMLKSKGEFGTFISEIQLQRNDNIETINETLGKAIKLLNIQSDKNPYEYWHTIIDWYSYIPREIADYVKSNINGRR